MKKNSSEVLFLPEIFQVGLTPFQMEGLNGLPDLPAFRCRHAAPLA
jgi:hypothetical protein